MEKMKLRQLLAGLLLLALFVAAFSSCKYRLKRTRVDEETEGASRPAEVVTELITEPPAPETTAARSVLPDGGMPVEVLEENRFRAAAMDTAGVLQLYTDAMNGVKLRCPGFTKTETQVIDRVRAGQGSLELANRILRLVAENLLTIGGSGSGVVTVPAHSDLQVRQKFPVYGENYGCGLTDLSLIDSAVCYTDGEIYKVVIKVREVLNPAPVDSEFGRIMTPAAREKIAGQISDVLTLLNLDDYLFDFRYADNEITALIERDTGNLISLTQRMVVNVDIDLNIDLLLFRTDFIEAHGTVINKLVIDSFDWSQQ